MTADLLDYEGRDTAPTTTELLHAWDRLRPRSQQKRLGMSDIGGCERRAGYRLAGTEPTNPSGSMQAVLGSAIHEVVNDIMLTLAIDGDLTEGEVEFLGVLGHFDRYHGKWSILVDVKTTSSRNLEAIKLHGADYQHRWQTHLYAAGLYESRGIAPKRIRIDYIARDTGEEFNWPNLAGAPFDPRDLRDALQWIRSVKETPVDFLPRKYLPDSMFCASCPFATLCWDGAPVGRNPLAVEYLEDPEAEDRAEQLFQIRQQIKALSATEERLKGSLDAVRPDKGGRVQVGNRTLNFTPHKSGSWQLRFVSGAAPQPAVGFDEELVQ